MIMNEVNFADALPMITIITDASFGHESKLAGWAAWAVCDRVRIKGMGYPKHHVNNSGEAEFIALVQGFIMATTHFLPAPGTRVLLQSDNQQALKVIDTRYARSQIMVTYVDVLEQHLVQHPGLKLEVRHVKGHQSSKRGPRYYCNNWADEQAGLQRRLAEKATLKKK